MPPNSNQYSKVRWARTSRTNITKNNNSNTNTKNNNSNSNTSMENSNNSTQELQDSISIVDETPDHSIMMDAWTSDHSIKSHTSFVCHSRDESESNDFEIDDDAFLDVKAATTKSAGSSAAAQSQQQQQQQQSTARRNSLWKNKRRHEKAVDQSVNLMDAESGRYSRNRQQQSSPSRPRTNMTGHGQRSLVDIWLATDTDTDNDDGGSSRQLGDSHVDFDSMPYKDSGRGRKWKWLLVFVVCLLLGALLAIPSLGVTHALSGSGNNNDNNNNSNNDSNIGDNDNDNDNDNDQEEEAPPPSVLDYLERDQPVAILPPEASTASTLTTLTTAAIPQAHRKHAIQFLVLDQGISLAQDFDDDTSAAFRALVWIDEMDTAFLPVPGFQGHPATSTALAQLLQRYALACLYFAMQVENAHGGDDDEEEEDGQRRRLRNYNYNHHSTDHDRRLGEPTDEEWESRRTFDLEWTQDGSVCTWPGVTCNTLEQVTGVDVSESLLNGPLPREIFLGSALPQLTTLDLSYNRLAGSLPIMKRTTTTTSQVGVTPAENQLQYVFLQHNSLKGNMDPIVELEQLIYLDASANEMTGDIPKDLPLRVNGLETLHLANNNFAGQLPSALASLTQLLSLDFEGNKFSGTVPGEWSQLTDLETLTLARCNTLEGEIPTALQSMREMRHLSLQETGISGPIPEFLGQLTQLEELYLHNTALIGNVPSTVCDLIESHRLETLTSDCSGEGKVTCDCCTDCWRR